MTTRRALLAAGLSLPLAGCGLDAAPRYDGDWVGASHQRGHRLRERKSGTLPAPAWQGRAAVLVIGAGVAGIACARGLLRGGVDDLRLFELEDEAGGNSRAHRIAGMACPLGAHYLPTPGPHAHEVAALLDELGVRRLQHGRAVYDERHLCHSPQERLYIDGQWHDGLLPPIDALPAAERATTQAQYGRFAALVHDAARGHAFAIPTARSTWRAALDALDAQTFARWLDGHGLSAPALRWYLDYCCRDDYGAGANEVSAWAGLHYFASRHGFHPPGSDDGGERDAVLTWPEGNAWLVQRMAAPLQQRLHTGMLALQVAEGRHGVVVDLWNARADRFERWSAPQVVLATPLFVAQRLLVSPPPALVDAAARVRYAPWLVANLHLDAALADPPGAPPSWDNVIYGGAGLGYVDAMHQSLRPHAGPTVLTHYTSWGGDPAHRRALLADSWQQRAAQVVQSLSAAHPDLPARLRRVDLARYGHAMSVPAPGVRSSAALRALAEARGRVRFAHSDLSGYSIFEEACTQGVRAAQAILATGAM
jgi:predicted NAD/FAD-binding protein